MSPSKVAIQNIYYLLSSTRGCSCRHSRYTIELKLKYFHTAHAQKMADLEEIQLTSGDETDKEVRLE